jgi:hypothetical protein
MNRPSVYLAIVSMLLTRASLRHEKGTTLPAAGQDLSVISLQSFSDSGDEKGLGERISRSVDIHRREEERTERREVGFHRTDTKLREGNSPPGQSFKKVPVPGHLIVPRNRPVSSRREMLPAYS